MIRALVLSGTILVRGKPGRMSMEGFAEEVDRFNHYGRAGIKMECLADWALRLQKEWKQIDGDVDYALF